jgi:hypothetical protein
VSDQSTQDSSTDPRVDAALRDYLEQLDRGHGPDPEAFLSQHAEIAGELRSLITAELQLRKLAARSPAETQIDSTQSFALHGQETIAPQRGTLASNGHRNRPATLRFGSHPSGFPVCMARTRERRLILRVMAQIACQTSGAHLGNAGSRRRAGAQLDFGELGRVAIERDDQRTIQDIPSQCEPPKSVVVSVGGRRRQEGMPFAPVRSTQ